MYSYASRIECAVNSFSWLYELCVLHICMGLCMRANILYWVGRLKIRRRKSPKKKAHTKTKQNKEVREKQCDGSQTAIPSKYTDEKYMYSKQQNYYCTSEAMAAVTATAQYIRRTRRVSKQHSKQGKKCVFRRNVNVATARLYIQVYISICL